MINNATFSPIGQYFTRLNVSVFTTQSGDTNTPKKRKSQDLNQWSSWNFQPFMLLTCLTTAFFRQLCVPVSSESQHVTSRDIYSPLSQEIWPLQASINSIFFLKLKDLWTNAAYVLVWTLGFSCQSSFSTCCLTSFNRTADNDVLQLASVF